MKTCITQVKLKSFAKKQTKRSPSEEITNDQVYYKVQPPAQVESDIPCTPGQKVKLNCHTGSLSLLHNSQNLSLSLLFMYDAS